MLVRPTRSKKNPPGYESFRLSRTAGVPNKETLADWLIQTIFSTDVSQSRYPGGYCFQTSWTPSATPSQFPAVVGIGSSKRSHTRYRLEVFTRYQIIIY